MWRSWAELESMYDPKTALDLFNKQAEERRTRWLLANDPGYAARSVVRTAAKISKKDRERHKRNVERTQKKIREERKREAKRRRSESRAMDPGRLARRIARLESSFATRSSPELAPSCLHAGADLAPADQAIAWKMQANEASFAGVKVVTELLGNTYQVTRGLAGDAFSADLTEAELAICSKMGTAPKAFAARADLDAVLPGPMQVERPGDNWRAPAPAIRVGANGFGSFQVTR